MKKIILLVLTVCSLFAQSQNTSLHRRLIIAGTAVVNSTNDVVGTFTIPNTIPNGNTSVNGLGTDFFNGAGQKLSNGIIVNSKNDFVIRTAYQAMDGEIDVNGQNIAILFGINGDTAIGFAKKGNQIGCVYFTHVAGIPTVPEMTGNDAISRSGVLIPNSPNAGNSGDYGNIIGGGNGTLTFGKVGAEMYAKWNGVKFISFKTHYRLVPGSIGIMTNIDGQGCTLPVIRLMGRSLLYSYGNYVDVRDFGAKPIKSTGSMLSTDPYKITCSDAAFVQQLKPGDRLITEIGGEAVVNGWLPAHRGGIGVGGNHPEEVYNTEAELLASRSSSPSYHIAWARDTRKTYGYYGPWSGGGRTDTAWYPKQYFTDVWTKQAEGNAYFAYTVPKSYRGRIISIAGNALSGYVLTMDTPCVNSTTNANIYYDNYDAFDVVLWNNLLPITFNVPSGTFACSQTLHVSHFDHSTFTGAGKDSTFILSPNGCPTAHILVVGDYMTIKNFTLDGCGRKNGYGFTWSGWNEHDGNNYTGVGANEEPSANDLFRGLQMGGAHEHLINVRVRDEFTAAFNLFLTDSYIEYCDVIHTTGVYQYMAWQMVVPGGGARDTFDHINVDFSELISALESFGTTGVVFRNSTVKNGKMSCNSGFGMRVENIDFNYTENAGAAPWANFSEPLLSFNHNAYNQGSGGGVDNIRFNFKGYFYVPTRKFVTGIGIINQYFTDVVLHNVHYTVDDSIAAMHDIQCVAIGSAAPYTTIDGVYSNAPNVSSWTSGSYNETDYTISFNTTGTNCIVRNCVVPSAFVLPGTTLSNNTIGRLQIR